MKNRDELLAIVERAYEARCSGDREALWSFLAPGATYSLNGERHALAALPSGRLAAEEAIAGLMERFQFHSIVRLNAVVEGSRAAVHSRVVVSTGAGDPVTTELLDLFAFDEEGRVTSIVQFADTELISQMLG